MQRNEQIGILGVGHRGAVFQGHETIILTRQDNLDTHFILELDGELFGDAQHHVFFRQAAGADRARVLAAVPWIQNDLAQIAHGRRRSVGFLCLRHGLACDRFHFCGRLTSQHSLLAFLPLKLDDQTVRIRKEKCVVRAEALHIEDNAHHIGAILAETNLAQQAVVGRHRIP